MLHYDDHYHETAADYVLDDGLPQLAIIIITPYAKFEMS